jgi:SAM-dependent methyltransferase
LIRVRSEGVPEPALRRGLVAALERDPAEPGPGRRRVRRDLEGAAIALLRRVEPPVPERTVGDVDQGGVERAAPCGVRGGGRRLGAGAAEQERCEEQRGASRATIAALVRGAALKERVYRFRLVERRLVASRPGARVLDVGCGVGENLVRLRRQGSRPVGVDPAVTRLRAARAVAPVVGAVVERLPFRDASFDLVYVSHVLHHATDLDLALAEAHRLLRPGGVCFVIETVDDSPLMRLARAIAPRWQGDPVLQRFRFADLVGAFERHGFEVRRGMLFNWMYFAWELLPLAFRPLELLTPIAIGIESLFAPLLRRFGGHCWLLATKRGELLYPPETWRVPD